MERRSFSWAPGLRALSAYRSRMLPRDLLAGVVLAAMLVPVGMAYARLAGLEPIAGVYASLLALIAYAVFGPSPVLVLGPDSSTAPLVAAVIVPLAVAGSGERTTLAAMLALATGLALVLVAVSGLGFITDLLSKPVRLGYLNGVAAVIIVSQLPSLFGFETQASGLLDGLLAFVGALGGTNTLSLLFGALALVAIVVVRRLWPRVPVILVVVAAATLLSFVLGVTSSGVQTVGVLPRGLPTLTMPLPDSNDILRLLAGAAGIALLTLADSTVLSECLASRRGSDTDCREELVALGAANVAVGLFQGFPVSGSVTRSAVNMASGAQSQMAGLVAAITLVLMLVLSPGVLASLPMPVLAAVVIAAGIELANVQGMARLLEMRRSEFTLSVASLASVILFGVLTGVLVAIALSVLNIVRRQWRPHDAVLGRVSGVRGYHDITDMTEAKQIPGLLIYRYDAPLFFANARPFAARLRTLVEDQAVPVRRVVLAAEPLIDVDTTASDVLADLIKELRSRGIEFAFAELKHPVRERLKHYGVIEVVGEERLYPTVGTAVRSYVRENGVTWVDWEEEHPEPGE